MKQLGLCAAFMLATNFLNAQGTMELTNKQQALVVISATEAKGDINGLKAAVNDGFEQGLTVSEIKEALSQLYAYTGFPRSLNALGALQQVIAERTQQGLKTEEGKEADPLPADYDALKQGTKVQTDLFGAFNYTFAPQTDYYLKAHLFGDIFARNNLSHIDREIVTVSAISALPGCEPQLNAHVAAAKKTGVTEEQLCQIPAVLSERVGEDVGQRCAKAVAQFLGQETAIVQTVDFSVWPKGDPNPYNKYFTGQSYLTMLGESGAYNVTFEPGCRNFWHIHHGAVQVLMCVAGRGWYQEWGKPAVQMTPGTVIAIPEGVKHWHGAAKDSWFQHVGYETDVQKIHSNEWLEEVSDEVYNQLP